MLPPVAVTCSLSLVAAASVLLTTQEIVTVAKMEHRMPW